MVTDRGMVSYKIALILKKSGASYILPLRRNFKKVDYSMELKRAFVYRNRGIKWGRRKLRNGTFIYLFEDVRMRSEEETSFISRVDDGKKKMKDMEAESVKFGKIALMSDLDIDGEEIYTMFKQREEIECAFDSLKNPLESDKTYLGNDDSVRGYFFVSFVALYIYCSIINRLKELKLLDKVSVRELLLELSKIYIVSDGKKEIISEVPKKAGELMEKLGKHIFPKI